MYWLKVFTAKQISGLVFTRYIREPINYLYTNGSTKSESKSADNFRFDIIGVARVYNPSSEISSESQLHTYPVQGRPHLDSAKPLDPRNSA
jgi:hypothetical protein